MNRFFLIIKNSLKSQIVSDALIVSYNAFKLAVVLLFKILCMVFGLILGSFLLKKKNKKL